MPKHLKKIYKGMKDRGYNTDPQQRCVKLKELRLGTVRFFNGVRAFLGGAATTTPPLCFDSVNGLSCNRDVHFGDEEEEEEEEVVEDSIQQARGVTVFSESQELFLTLDLEPVSPKPTQGGLPDPPGREGTSDKNQCPPDNQECTGLIANMGTEVTFKTNFTGPMEQENQTQVTEFIFLGFSSLPHGQAFLFLVFLELYLVTLVGNSMIFTLIQLDSHLHSPMYFFLSHLSCLDICFSSVTVPKILVLLGSRPKILVNFLREQETISYCECMAQMFFLMSCAGAECARLAVMAYDRYAAQCHHLRYTDIMSRRVCFPLAMGSWLWGLLDSAIHTFMASSLSFCGANQLPHLFCDVPPLLKIACSDTYVNELTLHLASIFVGLSPFLLIVISYLYILAAILRIHSNTGRRTARPSPPAPHT
ncbi:Olfactory receptor 5V1 [Chelonia mydas]|uniref:Olfactory receptor 5V1 n=1 Tax=Chelonia mydas TaxID=8469 RepID=M7BAR5_CHEMY|nr:Olfactory receptor 5V1 [Chelonia mydas]